MYLIARVLLLVGGTFLFQACSENTVSPEDEIRQFVESGVSAAENRSLDDLSSLMHDSYLDQKGYNKKQLGRLLRAYFFRHKNIHLFYLPTYSPEYNPVELFWKWIKPKVYGFSALGGIEELISRFRKLVWHYNNGNLNNPIRFNFHAYKELL